MIVTFYNVGKAKNSTWIPASGGKDYEGTLRVPSSILKPSITFQFAKDWSPKNINYCYIPEFSRYYFVDDWEYSTGLWVCYMEVDVMSSFKSEIGEKSYYILRTSVAYDGDLNDSLYPMKAVPVTAVSDADAELFGNVVSDLINGDFVIGITGSGGMATYYKMSYTSFVDFAKKVFSSTDWIGDLSSIGDDISKMVFNPSQYVTSVLWFPFRVMPSVSEVNIDLRIGYWKINVKAAEMFNRNLVETRITAITIPDHPQIARGKYLNSFPYRHVRVELQGLGIIDVAPGKIKSGVISIEAAIDYTTGYVQYILLDSNTHFVLANATGRVGLSLSIGDIKSGVAQAANTIAVGAIQALAGNPTGSAMSAAMSFHQLLKNDVSTVSNADTFIQMKYNTRALVTFYTVADEDNADNGRPYMKNGIPLSMGNGFYIVENGNVNIMGAYADEITMIKNYLEGGFYYA